MKKQTLSILLGLSFFLFVACKNQAALEKEAIEVCFNAVKNYALKENEAGIATLIDKASTEYLTEMLELIKNDSSMTAKEAFSKRQKYPLVTQLFLTAVDSNAIPYYNEAIPDVNNMIYFINSTGYGITNSKDGQRYYLKASNIMSENRAVAIMRIQVGYDKFVSSDINFYKEDKEWKLDLLSTHSFLSRYLQQQKKRYKGNPEEFISYFLHTGGTKDFQYYYSR